MSHAHHHGGGPTTEHPEGTTHLALVGSPNAGKTTLFNALTGLRAKTGNYPGVTVARYEGRIRTADGSTIVLEDLPGTYSLSPISPDEQVVVDVLDSSHPDLATPDGLVVTLDATSLERSLGLLAQVLATGLPTAVVLTFTDELVRRGGHLDDAALGRALGVPVLAVVAGRRSQLGPLRTLLANPDSWSRPPVDPPTDPVGIRSWTTSVLAAAQFRGAHPDRLTARIDAVLLHPVAGTLVFLATMFAFFQVLFSVAAPLQGYVEEFFAWLGGRVEALVPIDWLARFLNDGVIGGVGGVIVFLPQIALLFILISLLESVGYLARAAFLMDRVMTKAGLEGRAFVALLSSMACAIPGIMATRTLPSARDRLATMLSAPLMTCSARLPVYVLLIGLLVPSDRKVGPFGAQGTIMFALYVGGAISAMLTAWLFSRLAPGAGALLPFSMEMPPYRFPSARSVGLAVYDACLGFLRKVTTIILATTALLWVLLNVQVTSDQPTDIENSAAASIGRAVEPVFEPLGFDWRINIGVLASLSAREVFVATLGQVAAAENPDDPGEALAEMTVTDGDRAGEPLFTAPVIAALLVFFLYALQCVSTIAVLRRETGGWKWPGIAFGYMFALAWTMGLLAHTITAALT